MRAQELARRRPDPVEVDGVLADVDGGGQRCGRLAGSRQRWRPAGEEAVGLDLIRALVRLAGIAARRSERERVRDVEQAVARRGVEPRPADVGRGPAHQLEQLRVVEIRPGRPDPGRGTGDER